MIPLMRGGDRQAEEVSSSRSLARYSSTCAEFGTMELKRDMGVHHGPMSTASPTLKNRH